MNKEKLKQLNNVLEGKDLPKENKVAIYKEEIVIALTSLKKEIAKNKNKDIIEKLDKVINKVKDNKPEVGLKKLIDDNKEIKSLLGKLDKEYPKEFKVNNINEVLLKLNELKTIEQPKWYKQLDILGFFEKLKNLLEYFSKKTYKTTIENKKPVKVLYVDEKGKPKEMVNRVQIPLGAGGTSNKTKLLDKDGSYIDNNNRLPVDATLTVSDIEIGAVELKDGDTDTRADIESDGTKNALFVQANNDSLGVQQVQSNSSNIATETTLGLIKDTDGIKKITDTVSVQSNSANIATESTLGLIKDTDGIKKITDAVTVEQATAASLKALVNPNYLVFDSTAGVAVAAGLAIRIFDASTHANATFVVVANCGTDEIYVHTENDVSSIKFTKRIASGESWEFPIGNTGDGANDLYSERATGTGNVQITVYKDN